MAHIFTMLMALLTSLTMGVTSHAQTTFSTHALKTNVAQEEQVETNIEALNTSPTPSATPTGTVSQPEQGQDKDDRKVTAYNEKSGKEMPGEVSIVAVEHAKALIETSPTPTPSIVQNQTQVQSQTEQQDEVDTNSHKVFGQTTAQSTLGVSDGGGRAFGLSVSSEAKFNGKDK